MARVHQEQVLGETPAIRMWQAEGERRLVHGLVLCGQQTSHDCTDLTDRVEVFEIVGGEIDLYVEGVLEKRDELQHAERVHHAGREERRVRSDCRSATRSVELSADEM